MQMLPFNSEPALVHRAGNFIISDFISGSENNIHPGTVDSFSKEWGEFHFFTDTDIKTAGDQYFDIVSTEMLGPDKTALDLGCGSGRWSKYLSQKIGFIEAIDPSDAVFAAAHLLSGLSNVRITKASADKIPFADGSFDFIFSLGVLHHIPDTAHALQLAARKLKRNGCFHLYLYYNFDNRGRLYRSLFNLSDSCRKLISGFSPYWKRLTCNLIAIFIYSPFVLLSKFVRIFSKEGYKKIPLSYYADKRFYIIQNDALDRFGTPLEQRFSKEQITHMMKKAGLSDIVFSEHAPYWHAIGKKI